MGEEFIPVNLDAVESVVDGYRVQRDAMVSQGPTHLQFIAFCNAQAQLLNKALGMRDENELRWILRVQQEGSAPLSTRQLDDTFAELLITLIAYLAAKRERIAGQN